MSNSRFIGIAAALFAALAWSLNFILPFVIGQYSVFDTAVIRFVVTGAMGLCILAFRIEAVRRLSYRDWLVATGLALIGYVGYFLTVVGAAIFAGPVIAPAFLGLVPIVLAISGNFRHRTVAWSSLVLPLLLTLVGLALVNISVFDPQSMSTARSLVVGIPLAVLSVSLWTVFGLANQEALARRPHMDSGVWTALILVGSGVIVIVLTPLGLALGVFATPRLGLAWPAAAPFLMWSISLGVISMFGGALAWTVASQRLPGRTVGAVDRLGISLWNRVRTGGPRPVANGRGSMRLRDPDRWRHRRNPGHPWRAKARRRSVSVRRLPIRLSSRAAGSRRRHAQSPCLRAVPADC